MNAASQSPLTQTVIQTSIQRFGRQIDAETMLHAWLGLFFKIFQWIFILCYFSYWNSHKGFRELYKNVPIYSSLNNIMIHIWNKQNNYKKYSTKWTFIMKEFLILFPKKKKGERKNKQINKRKKAITKNFPEFLLNFLNWLIFKLI